MININRIASSIQRAGKRYLPAVLTVAGTISAVTAGMYIEKNKTDIQKRFEKFKQKRDAKSLVSFVKILGPAVALASTSVVCIVKGQSIHFKRFDAANKLACTAIGDLIAYRARVEKKVDADTFKKIEGNTDKLVEREGTDEHGKKFKDYAAVVSYPNLRSASSGVWFTPRYCSEAVECDDIYNLVFVQKLDAAIYNIIESTGVCSLNLVLDRLGHEPCIGGDEIGWTREIPFRMAYTRHYQESQLTGELNEVLYLKFSPSTPLWSVPQGFNMLKKNYKYLYRKKKQ